MAKAIKGAYQRTGVSRLLRSQTTHYYLTDRGWTANPEEARKFSDSVEAAEACAQQGLTDVELSLWLEPKGCELFCLPLR